MSEEFTELPREIEQLDAAMSDPKVERVLALARGYSDLLKGANISKEDRLSIQDELDEAWGGFNQRPFTVSGYVSTRVEGDDGDKIDRRYVEDVFVPENKGFVLYDDESIVLDGSALTSYRIGLLLWVKASEVLPIEVVDENGWDDNTHVSVVADINEIDMQCIDLSFDRASAWLSVSSPDVMVEIEQRMFDDHESEEGALLSLRDLDLNTLVDLSDSFTRKCLDLYFSETLEFDKEMAYVVDIEGDARLESADQDELLPVRVESRGLPVSLHRVFLYPSTKYELNTSWDDVKEWDLVALMQLHFPDMKTKARQFLVPVNTLRSVRSMRRVLYAEK